MHKQDHLFAFRQLDEAVAFQATAPPKITLAPSVIYCEQILAMEDRRGD